MNFAHEMREQCQKIMQKLGLECDIKLFFNSEDILREYSKGAKTDIFFIDIMLGQKNGIDLAIELKERGCTSSVVLMTMESSFLLAGYSAQPLYFLMKPISLAELEKAIKLDLKHQAESQSIVLKCSHNHIQVPVGSITYIEVLDHELTVHTNNRDYTMRMTFNRILDELPASRFARCHNSYAVNLARVSHFSRLDGVSLDCGVTLPLGRKYFDEFKKLFIEYIDIC